MKVRNLKKRAMPRAKVQRKWNRRQMRKAHKLVLQSMFTHRNLRMTLSFCIYAIALEKGMERLSESMSRPSYRRRTDRLFAEARRTGGRILHRPFRRTIVVPKEKS